MILDAVLVIAVIVMQLEIRWLRQRVEKLEDRL